MPSAEGLSPYRVAVVQVPPVVLDRVATLARAVERVEEAADAGARLVAFPESFIPGYPDWIWRLRPFRDFATTSDIWSRFLPETVDLEHDELAPLRKAARRRHVTVTVGITERDGEFSRSTVYNSFVSSARTAWCFSAIESSSRRMRSGWFGARVTVSASKPSSRRSGGSVA